MVMTIIATCALQETHFRIFTHRALTDSKHVGSTSQDEALRSPLRNDGQVRMLENAADVPAAEKVRQTALRICWCVLKPVVKVIDAIKICSGMMLNETATNTLQCTRPEPKAHLTMHGAWV